MLDVLELAKKGQTDTLTKCLGQLLQDDKVVKVFHDLRFDAFILLKVCSFRPLTQPTCMPSVGSI